jgi:hypothetical protein
MTVIGKETKAGKESEIYQNIGGVLNLPMAKARGF